MTFLQIATLSIALLGQTTPLEAPKGEPAHPAPAAAAQGHGQGGGEEHAGGGHGVSPMAQDVFGMKYLTNSILVAVIVCLLITFFVSRAMRKPELIPGKKQNVVELLVEFLYKQVENIVGPHVAPRAFPLLATIFVFTLVSNYFGLLPGVGTVGFTDHVGPFFSATHLNAPLLRPATADMNFTVGMALAAMIIWFWLTMKELGPWGFIVHTFGPKGGLKGALKYFLMPIFMFVGVIELISIVFRPVSLSFRLYGNIFAGENLLHVMGGMGEKWGPVGSFLSSVVLPLPFYFLELLVGVLQALVFALLCAVYIQLSTTHEEGHGDEHH